MTKEKISDIAEFKKVLNENKTKELHFVSMCNLRSQEDIQIGCLLEVDIMGLDFEPLASIGDKVWVAINKHNNFVVRI